MCNYVKNQVVEFLKQQMENIDLSVFFDIWII